MEQKNKFKIGDYVFAEDWCYGKIVYIDDNPRKDSFIFLSAIDEICKEFIESK